MYDGRELPLTPNRSSASSDVLDSIRGRGGACSCRELDAAKDVLAAGLPARGDDVEVRELDGSDGKGGKGRLRADNAGEIASSLSTCDARQRRPDVARASASRSTTLNRTLAARTGTVAYTARSLSSLATINSSPCSSTKRSPTSSSGMLYMAESFVLRLSSDGLVLYVSVRRAGLRLGA